MGTGGGNMPIVAFDTYNQTTSEISQTIKSHSANNENIGAVAYSIREDAKANTFSATETHGISSSSITTFSTISSRADISSGGNHD